MAIALVNCVVCQTEVSPYAHYCPSCAHPFKQEPKGPVVVVTGFDISFSDWITLWLKSSIAMIPAMLVLAVFGTLFWLVVGGLLAGLFG